MEHTAVWEGVGGKGETWRGSPQWNTKDQLPKPQTATLATARSGPSKAAHVKHHIPEQPGWNTERTASSQLSKLSKKGVKLVLKTIGNRKGDCCSRWQTQPEKISKLQSTNQYNVRSEWYWFVRCDLQIFSGCVCHFEQLHAQSPFLFPIVFSIDINLNWFFDVCSLLAVLWSEQEHFHKQVLVKEHLTRTQTDAHTVTVCLWPGYI